jgi:hypothetical protein
MDCTKPFTPDEDLGKGVHRFQIRALGIMRLDAK